MQKAWIEKMYSLIKDTSLSQVVTLWGRFQKAVCESGYS